MCERNKINPITSPPKCKHCFALVVKWKLAKHKSIRKCAAIISTPTPSSLFTFLPFCPLVTINWSECHLFSSLFLSFFLFSFIISFSLPLDSYFVLICLSIQYFSALISLSLCLSLSLLFIFSTIDTSLQFIFLLSFIYWKLLYLCYSFFFVFLIMSFFHILPGKEVVSTGLFWFYSWSFSYNGVCFLWFIFNRTLGQYRGAHSFCAKFWSAESNFAQRCIFAQWE